MTEQEQLEALFQAQNVDNVVIQHSQNETKIQKSVKKYHIAEGNLVPCNASIINKEFTYCDGIPYWCGKEITLVRLIGTPLNYITSLTGEFSAGTEQFAMKSDHEQDKLRLFTFDDSSFQ